MAYPGGNTYDDDRDYADFRLSVHFPFNLQDL
jgi:hypothetical protein